MDTHTCGGGFWRGLVRFLTVIGALFVSLIGLGSSIQIAHAETYIDEGFLFQDTVWNASNSPYIIRADITVPFGRKLILGPGTIVMSGASVGYEPNIYVNGTFDINGEKLSPVSINGIYGITIDHSTSTISYAQIQTRDGVSFIGSHGFISSSTINGSSRGIYVKTGDVSIVHSKIKNNEYGVFVEPVPEIFQVNNNSLPNTGGIGNAFDEIAQANNSPLSSNVIIRDSALTENSIAAIKNTDSSFVIATNNWWGSDAGPTQDSTSTPNVILGPVLYEPWLDHDPTQEVSRICCSSVLFIPGLEGSWLYRNQESIWGGTTTNTLWVPNWNEDVRKLFLNPDGSSIDPTIYSGQPIDKVFGFYEIYNSFIKFMDSLVQRGIVNEWKPFGYDWRKPITEVVTGNEKKATTTESLILLVNELASRSRTGKVTIVAHSNGGLVAKYLVKIMADSGKSDLIDSVISVATPEIGTPSALSAILHGDHQSIAKDLVLKPSVARELGQNMPSSYSLLPSSAYFSAISSPTIKISSSTFGLPESSISSDPAQKNFITNYDFNRTQPNPDDVLSPIIGNSLLVSAAQSVHSILDNFVWPTSTNSWSIAGWNVETPKTLSYSSVIKCTRFLWFDTDCHPEIRHKEIMTNMGDGTVVTQSANYGNHDQISIDLGVSSKSAGKNITHVNILEATSTQTVIEKIITASRLADVSQVGLDSEIVLGQPSYRPDPERIVVTAGGDVDTSITDSYGNHTGATGQPTGISDDLLLTFEEKIPESRFISSNKISLAGSGGSYTAVVRGNSLGSFDLNINRVQGENDNPVLAFYNVPSSPLSVSEVTFTGDISSSTVVNSSSTVKLPAIKVDIDGDGSVDFVATDDAVASTTPIVRLELLKKYIRSIYGPDHSSRMRGILQRIDGLEDRIKKGKFNFKDWRISKLWSKLSHKVSPKISIYKHVKSNALSQRDRPLLIEDVEEAVAGLEEGILD